MHIRIATEAVIGSSPRMLAISGFTAAAGLSEKSMTRKPITAFQKPTTAQGKGIVKSTRNARPPGLDGGAATAARPDTAAGVAPTERAKRARRRAGTRVMG